MYSWSTAQRLAIGQRGKHTKAFPSLKKNDATSAFYTPKIPYNTAEQASKDKSKPSVSYILSGCLFDRVSAAGSVLFYKIADSLAPIFEWLDAQSDLELHCRQFS